MKRLFSLLPLLALVAGCTSLDYRQIRDWDTFGGNGKEAPDGRNWPWRKPAFLVPGSHGAATNAVPMPASVWVSEPSPDCHGEVEVVFFWPTGECLWRDANLYRAGLPEFGCPTTNELLRAALAPDDCPSRLPCALHQRQDAHRGGYSAAVYVPGWCRNGGDSAQELALLADAYPDTRCEAHTWEGDGIDFWACRDEADAEGRRFGATLAALPEEERAGLVLVGHSLGARIVVRALAALAAEGKTVRRGVLLAAALPEDDPDLAAAVRGSAEPLVCISSQSDAMLKWCYGAGGENLEQALGLNGWPAPVPTNVVQRYLPASFTDGFVPDAPLMDFAAMRRLCLHYAPFYLRYLADLVNPLYAEPPEDPDVVRQGYPNLSLRTMDKEVFWVVEDRLPSGWKLERNTVFGQWRILDPDSRRKAWGDEASMRRSFDELRARQSASQNQKTQEPPP